MGKGEIAHFEIFYRFPQCFPTAFSLKMALPILGQKFYKNTKMSS